MAALHDRKVAAAFALFAAAAFAQDLPQPPGFRLGDAASPVSYDVVLAVDPAQPEFTGEARIALRVKAATPIVWMNAQKLAITSVEAVQGDRKIDVEALVVGTDFLALRSKGEPFAAGEAKVVLKYRGIIEPLAHRGLFRLRDAGEAYAVTQHEEIDARRTFPCFDEPGWKTPWTLTIDAPAKHVVVSNAPEVRATDIADRAGWRRHEFAPTKPLPSYLVAFAVGPFDIIDGGTAGMNHTPIRYIVPKGRGADLRSPRATTPRLLEILEEYFGMPYPFEKLDSLALPDTYDFGGMENAALITYSADILLSSEAQETPAQRRKYAGFAAHEVAHMWFGDYVTPAWWDDVWLNESFASWMGSKAVYRLNPAWDTGESRAHNRALAIAIDRLSSARRVRNPIAVKDDLASAFTSITYQKGSAVLEMFEASIGKGPFRAGVRDYLAEHAWGSASANDFFRAIAKASGRAPETLAAFEAFVDQSGVPLLDVELACGKAPAALEVSQQRLRPKGSTSDDRQWTTPACFRYPAPIPGPMGDGRSQCEMVSNAPRTIALSGGPACPAWVLGNEGGTGHYVVRYGPFLWKRNLRFATSLSVHEAAAFVSDTGLLAESGLVPIEQALDLADAVLAHRSPVVQLVALRLLDRIADGWLTPAQAKRKRAIVAQRVQPLARRLGWHPKAGEPDEVGALRAALLPFAARSEGGGPLRTEARRLAVAWMRDRASLGGAMVPAMLDTAARFADRATYELLESLMLTTKDGVERQQIQAALAKVRDPALRARALNLAIKRTGDAPAIAPREATIFVREAIDDEANRAAAFEFVRANYPALAAKLPPSATTRFATGLQRLCTRQDRDAFVAFFKDRMAPLEGGRHRYEEALEVIDLCIAARS